MSGLEAERIIERIKAGEHLDLVEVMACPGAAYAAQASRSYRRRGATAQRAYNANVQYPPFEDNPLMAALYEGILKERFTSFCMWTM